MSTLRWGIKSSLVRYVEAMPDGTVTCSSEVTRTPQGFVFPGTDLNFIGWVQLVGHGGMLNLLFKAPALEQGAHGWHLTIADPDTPSERLVFASIATFDGTHGSVTTLTQDGADLFFGPYELGTVLDDPTVEPC